MGVEDFIFGVGVGIVLFLFTFVILELDNDAIDFEVETLDDVCKAIYGHNHSYQVPEFQNGIQEEIKCYENLEETKNNGFSIYEVKE